MTALLVPALVLSVLAAMPARTQADETTPADDSPVCLTRCIDMRTAGTMREGMTLIACTLLLCQEDGRRYYRQGKFEEALRSMEQVKQMAQASASYHLDLGLIYYALGRFSDALKSFETVLNSFPQSVRASAQRAHTLIRMDRLPEARAQFEAILTYDTADEQFKNLKTRSYVAGNLAVLELSEGDLDAGKAGLDGSLEIDARNKLARTYLTRVYPELAEGRLAPEGVLMLLVVWEELEFGRANSAVQKLGIMLSKWPDFKLGYIVAADAQRKYGNVAACESTMIAATTRFPDDPNLHAERIRCTLMRKGVHSMAALPDIQELKELAARDPDDPLIQEMLELINE